MCTFRWLHGTKPKQHKIKEMTNTNTDLVRANGVHNTAVGYNSMRRAEPR